MALNSIPTLNGRWVNYSPTFVAITPGNGTTVARYSRIGNTIIGYVKFTLGSTSSVTGQVQIPLPFAPSNGAVNYAVQIGDVGTAAFNAFGEVVGSNFYVYVSNTTTTYGNNAATSSTVPMTWTTNDFISFNFAYEVA
jgi:hypothetical protein